MSIPSFHSPLFLPQFGGGVTRGEMVCIRANPRASTTGQEGEIATKPNLSCGNGRSRRHTAIIYASARGIQGRKAADPHGKRVRAGYRHGRRGGDKLSRIVESSGK